MFMKNKTSIYTIIYLTLGYFLFTSTMSMLNRDIAGNVEGRHMFLYMLQSFSLVIGLLLYPFFRQTLGLSYKTSRKILVLTGTIYIIGILSVGYITDYAYIVTLMILLPITMGYSQGMIYVHLVRDMYDERHMGRIFSSALGIAIFLQFILQIKLNIGTALPVLMCCIYIFLIIWEFGVSDEIKEIKDPAVNVKPDCLRDRGFLRISAIAICLIILANYLDGQMELLLDTSYFFSWARLFYSVGFIAMGLLWDMKNKRIASTVMVTAAILSILMPAFLMNKSFWMFDICFFYFYLGFCVIYNSLRFMSYARSHGDIYPAVAYRFFDNLITGLLVLVGFSGISFLSAFIVDTILLAVTVFLIFRDCTADTRSASDISKETITDVERLSAFVAKYKLTDRESEVCELLITKDEKGEDMAKELGVSRRGFVSLASAVYKKTETGSRIALLQKYMSDNL